MAGSTMVLGGGRCRCYILLHPMIAAIMGYVKVKDATTSSGGCGGGCGGVRCCGRLRMGKEL